MTHSKSTPDERFLTKLYEVAMKAGDSSHPIDYLTIIKQLGIKETAAKNMVKHLAQANFLKRTEGTTVVLTERGRAFVLNHLDA